MTRFIYFQTRAGIVFVILLLLLLFIFICTKNSSSSHWRSSVASAPQHASAGNKRLVHLHKPFLPRSTCAQEKERKKEKRVKKQLRDSSRQQAVTS